MTPSATSVRLQMCIELTFLPITDHYPVGSMPFRSVGIFGARRSGGFKSGRLECHRIRSDGRTETLLESAKQNLNGVKPICVNGELIETHGRAAELANRILHAPSPRTVKPGGLKSPFETIKLQPISWRWTKMS